MANILKAYRLPEELIESYSTLAKETERPVTFYVRKALEAELPKLKKKYKVREEER